ncbi:MAG: thiamine-phosphate pyrophosphorylase, partial [Kiritimatiellia bacterium]
MRIPRLHVITDEVLQTRFGHVELARLAIEGGADAIQYRDKRAVPDVERLRVANALAQLCSDAGVQLVIDDRADIASLVGAW